MAQVDLRQDVDGLSSFNSVDVAGHEGMVPVVLEAREGRTLFVRELDPGDVLEPIPFDPSKDDIVLMTPIHSTMICQSDQVGADDSLTGPLRVVLEEREGSKVYVRTLRPGEPDDGRRVHLRPGEQIAFRPGALSVDLNALDEQFANGVDGYAPLTNTVWTWLSIGNPTRDRSRDLYLIAASRRLDAAAAAWDRVVADLPTVEDLASMSSNPHTRAMVFRLVADVELVIIGLRRVVDMVERASDAIGSTVVVPQVVHDKSSDLKAIRDAFEHIDERALGWVKRKPHPAATSVFTQHRLLNDHVIAYDSHEVSFDEVSQILDACRQFLKDVASGS